VQTKVDLAKAWVHESRRIFCDRLVNSHDYQWVNKLLQTTLLCHTAIEWRTLFPTSSDDLIEASHADDHRLASDDLVIYCDFLYPGADPKVCSLAPAPPQETNSVCVPSGVRGDQRLE
jgi:hypothetical protein